MEIRPKRRRRLRLFAWDTVLRFSGLCRDLADSRHDLTFTMDAEKSVPFIPAGDRRSNLTPLTPCIGAAQAGSARQIYVRSRCPVLCMNMICNNIYRLGRVRGPLGRIASSASSTVASSRSGPPAAMWNPVGWTPPRPVPPEPAIPTAMRLSHGSACPRTEHRPMPQAGRRRQTVPQPGTQLGITDTGPSSEVIHCFYEWFLCNTGHMNSITTRRRTELSAWLQRFRANFDTCRVRYIRLQIRL